MRSAVPLPCLFDVVKSQNVAEGQVEGCEGQVEGYEGLLERSEGLLEGSEGLLEGGGRTDGQNFSPFYRIFSPDGAAALLPYETF